MMTSVMETDIDRDLSSSIPIDLSTLLFLLVINNLLFIRFII